jgi:hypothetical protein
VELLANPLSQQAGKWLVIRRRPESSDFIKHAFGFCPRFAGLPSYYLDSGLRRNDN